MGEKYGTDLNVLISAKITIRPKVIVHRKTGCRCAVSKSSGGAGSNTGGSENLKVFITSRSTIRQESAKVIVHRKTGCPCAVSKSSGGAGSNTEGSETPAPKKRIRCGRRKCGGARTKIKRMLKYIAKK